MAQKDKKVKKVLPVKQNVYVFEKFEYYAEDLNCSLCLHRNECVQKDCPFEDIREEAIANGRIERERGYFDYD